ncbi:MAG: galactose mutarotase [Treponema sp.]|nr:galactose mutarotase [Treponema sp.]
MKISKQRFGVLSDGTKVTLYTIQNKRMSFSVTDYGCTITSVVLTDSSGGFSDVVLGYSTLDGYITGTCFFGAFIGRFANRIGKASFSLDGTKYKLDKNDGQNMLHGGFSGWDKKVWHAKTVNNKTQAGVKFTRFSHDGEQGFPGNMKIEVTYLLDDMNNITCRYTAVTDKACPVNFTNHSYFNLAGSGTVDDHILKLSCDYTLDIDSKLIPTGKLLDVENTPFDFRTDKKIGHDIKETGNGYDHCYVTHSYDPDNPHCGSPVSDERIVRVAELTEPVSGRCMTVDSNMEGIQLYTGNWIGGIVGKNGQVYEKHGAVCLETQCFPDSPNKKDFPSCILLPGEKYKAVTVYGFKF